MNHVDILNTVMSGFIFTIWSKQGWINIFLKLAFLTMFALNLGRLYGKI